MCLFKNDYLIDWTGYPAEDQSWEHHSNLNCTALLAAYETKLIGQVKNKQANMNGELEDIREELTSLTDVVNQRQQQIQHPQMQQQEQQQQYPQDPATYESLELVEPEQADQNVDVPQNLLCKECGLLLSNKYALNRHCANMHNANAKSTKKVKPKQTKQSKPFTCSHCAMNFTRSEVLQKHISRKHTNHSDAQFTCTVCSKKFISPFNLRDHIPICRRRSQSSKSETQTSPNETL